MPWIMRSIVYLCPLVSGLVVWMKGRGIPFVVNDEARGRRMLTPVYGRVGEEKGTLSV